MNLNSEEQSEVTNALWGALGTRSGMDSTMFSLQMGKVFIYAKLHGRVGKSAVQEACARDDSVPAAFIDLVWDPLWELADAQAAKNFGMGVVFSILSALLLVVRFVPQVRSLAGRPLPEWFDSWWFTTFLILGFIMAVGDVLRGSGSKGK